VLLSTFWRYRNDFEGWGTHQGVWIPILAFAYLTIVCGRAILSPLRIFSADDHGILISKGWLFQQTIFIAWDKLQSVERSSVRETVSVTDGKSTYASYGAIKISFNAPVTRWRSGYAFAYFRNATTYVIEERLLKMSIDEAISFIRARGELNHFGATNRLR